MKFLLDTNAISEIIRSRPDPDFMAWFTSAALDRELDDALHISILTIGELRRGVLNLPEGERRRPLQSFVDQTVADYRARIIGIDLAVIEEWAVLAHQYRARGVVVGMSDELIAATALVHDLTLVTRNVRHFEHSACRILSPWSG